jgi:hypothetical protein
MSATADHSYAAIPSPARRGVTGSVPAEPTQTLRQSNSSLPGGASLHDVHPYSDVIPAAGVARPQAAIGPQIAASDPGPSTGRPERPRVALSTAVQGRCSRSVAVGGRRRRGGRGRLLRARPRGLPRSSPTRSARAPLDERRLPFARARRGKHCEREKKPPTTASRTPCTSHHRISGAARSSTTTARQTPAAHSSRRATSYARHRPALTRIRSTRETARRPRLWQ